MLLATPCTILIADKSQLQKLSTAKCIKNTTSSRSVTETLSHWRCDGKTIHSVPAVVKTTTGARDAFESNGSHGIRTYERSRITGDQQALCYASAGPSENLVLQLKRLMKCFGDDKEHEQGSVIHRRNSGAHYRKPSIAILRAALEDENEYWHCVRWKCLHWPSVLFMYWGNRRLIHMVLVEFKDTQ